MSRRQSAIWERLLTRDNIWLLIGAIIAFHEVFMRSDERPFVLALAGALMGLPFVINADRSRNGGNGK